MKVFITGGTGFIGSHILVKLIKEGYTVTALVRNKNKIPFLQKCKNLQLVEGNVSDKNLIKRTIPGHDICIHVALNWGEPGAHAMLMTDTAASIYLADTAAEAGCKHFIYTSSTAVDDYFYMVPENEREDKSRIITSDFRHMPATYYGATKAATENYLQAISYSTKMRINIVRPGYTFGNPAVEGAPMQSDNRFSDIALKILKGFPVEVIKNDGTQFIWAGDLAGIYLCILRSNFNRKVYFGLSARFVSWKRIAEWAKDIANSSSPVNIIDKGYSSDPVIFDVSDIEKDFNLSFDPEERIKEHLLFYMKNAGFK